MHRCRGAGNVLTVLALALTAGACSSSGRPVSTAPTTVVLSGTTAPSTTAAGPLPTTTTCHGAPVTTPVVPWLPADLPLPPGSLLAFDSSTDSSHHRAQIDVPDPVTATVSFLTAMWTQQGWTVKAAPIAGQPQRYGYSRPRSNLSGVVSVVALACDQAWSEVTLTLTSH
jgi:hypothetical protein